MQNNDQKGSLKDTFSDFGAAPTDGLWNAISEKLDEKKKRRFLFWWWSAGLAAVLVVGFAVWNMNQPSTKEKLTGGRSYSVHAETNSVETNTLKGGIAVAAVDSLHLHAPFVLIWDPSMFPFNFNFMDGYFNNYPFYSDSYSGYTPWNPYQPSVDLEANNKRSTDSLKNEELLIAQVDSSNPAPTDSTVRSTEIAQVLLRVIPKKWQLGLFAGRSQAFTQSNPLIDGIGSNSSQSMGVNPAIETHYSWDVDLTVSRLIFRRWWLGTGVHFGVLGSGNISETSDYKSGKVNYTAIGVPLSIGRDFWIGGRFHITPMVGFRYDYAFRKTEEYTYKEPDVSISSADATPTYVKTSETAKLNLFSTSISAELALRLRGNWSIVAKPTTQFYLYGKTDETNPNTFRKVWFGGSVGVTKRF
ncbi:MAG: autotransporter outer membrane beta-barrel domain-containing protein [Fluviicola sp.]|nr:autotransporter outer membrane beta-barrel domain-containing protein [Fluviicola sp.]